MRPRPLCNIQGFRAAFATRCQSASGREKDLSLFFFFFPMDGFTLGIPSIFKIRISTLTLTLSRYDPGGYIYITYLSSTILFIAFSFCFLLSRLFSLSFASLRFLDFFLQRQHDSHLVQEDMTLPSHRQLNRSRDDDQSRNGAPSYEILLEFVIKN
jgi:hypothetical protein